VARPRKTLNPDQIKQLEALSAFLTLEQIADYFGIANSTLRLRIQEDQNILGAYKRGRARAHASVGGNILQQALAGNLTAAIFYAKTQMGWRETKQVEANITNGNFVIDLVDEDANDKNG
jgi:hypothetical protein